MSAFPSLALNWNSDQGRFEYALEGGLTKRELFAKAALQGIRAHYGWDASMSREIAWVAVMDADALLAALEATP